MKMRLIPLFLSFCLMLGGCDFLQAPQQTTPSEQQTTTPDAPSHEDVLRREVYDYKTEYFAFPDSPYAVKFEFPYDWEIYFSPDRNYTIERDGEEIGSLFVGNAADSKAWTDVSTDEHLFRGLTITESLQSHIDGSYRLRFRYTYDDGGVERILTLTVAYQEVDEYSEFQLFENTHLINVSEKSQIGILADADPSSIAIFGNSFIASSDIGSILNDMLEKNGKLATVNAVSRGYAEVSTYSGDFETIGDIESGRYDMVLICGFYSAAEVSHLARLKEACDVSGTRLVMFPAHNEGRGKIDEMKKAFPNLEILDWKAEVDALIAAGVERSLFCIDDQHQHSTPLAGYVGAHLIYRAIYGSVPTKYAYGSVTVSSINHLPQSYVESGSLIEQINPIGE